MTKLIDPRFTQVSWKAHSAGVNVLLGLNEKAKLPVEGMPARMIQGVKVWVEPLQSTAKFSGVGVRRTGRRMTHRVKCECPSCGKVLSVGRLEQHRCK